MLKNYLKVALRNLLKHRLYSLINIGGLALGLACAILIFLWVRDEIGYDRFHANADVLYRIAWCSRRTSPRSFSAAIRRWARRF